MILMGENGASVQFGVDLPPREHYWMPVAEHTRAALRSLSEQIAAHFGARIWMQPTQLEVTPFFPPEDTALHAELRAFIDQKLTGDMGITAEDELVESGAKLDATVLKVGHHGSAGSTGYVFLREVMPEYGVISVGADNSYGHPTEAALSRLRDADVKLFRTDLQGVVHAVSDGKSVTFETERTAADAQINPTIEDAPQIYIGNKNSRIFHVSTCRSCPAEQNQVRFETVWDAMAQGYRAHSCVE